MPPFLGQGMCSGIRDAQNLAFKLDLILRGLAGDALLDTYQTEREPHVTFVVLKGKELGSIQTMRDPRAAARRDEEYLARRRASVTPDKVVFPGLGPGVVRADDPSEGRLAIQGRVARPGTDGPGAESRADGGTNLFDRVVGYGATLVVDGRAVSRAEADGLADGSSYVGRVVVVGGDGDVADTAGDYAAHFDELGVVGVLVRPDFYMYGSARQPGELGDLVRSYEGALAGPVGQGAQASAPSMRA
jgi:3-(3-hydroxy-phenyl)propionate hydroxylase/flavoprotein hydroxylase